MRKQTLILAAALMACSTIFVVLPAVSLAPLADSAKPSDSSPEITLQIGQTTKLDVNGAGKFWIGAPNLVSAERTDDGLTLKGVKPGYTTVAIATQTGTKPFRVRVASAQSAQEGSGPDVRVKNMKPGQSDLIAGTYIERVAVNSPEIVEVVPVSNTEVILNAKKDGTATVRIWDKDPNNPLREYKIIVATPSPSADEMVEQIREQIGIDSVSVRVLGDTVFLTGVVDFDEEVKWVDAVGARTGKKVVNLVRVQSISSEKVVESIKSALNDQRLKYDILTDGTIMVTGTVPTREESMRIKDIIAAWASDAGGQQGSQASANSSTYVNFGGQTTAPDISDTARVEARRGENDEVVVGAEFNVFRTVFSGRIPNGPKIIAALDVNPAVARQVLVCAQILEVDRSKLKKQGIDWGSLGTFTQPFVIVEDRSPNVPLNDAGPLRRLPFGATINALLDDNSIRVLSEPKLLIADGHPANILVGGELPIPVAQNTDIGSSSISVVYKPFGIQLTVRPRIAPDNRILLTVSPEVSDLDYTNAVRAAGIEIPSMTVRKATTTVHVENGQSLAVGGLLSSSETKIARAIPILSKIPIIGELFKSKEHRKKDTELIILVTPRIVENGAQVPISSPEPTE